MNISRKLLKVLYIILDSGANVCNKKEEMLDVVHGFALLGPNLETFALEKTNILNKCLCKCQDKTLCVAWNVFKGM